VGNDMTNTLIAFGLIVLGCAAGTLLALALLAISSIGDDDDV